MTRFPRSSGPNLRSISTNLNLKNVTMKKPIALFLCQSKPVFVIKQRMALIRFYISRVYRTGNGTSLGATTLQVLIKFIALLIFLSIVGIFGLRRYRYFPASPPHWISPKQESQNWDQGGADRTQLVTIEFKTESGSNKEGDRITQKSKKAYSQTTTAPFLSLSSSPFNVPVRIPAPWGMIFQQIAKYITYRIANKMSEYLVADWKANDRKEELLYHMKNLIDYGRLLQIKCFRILIWYLEWKWLYGPPDDFFYYFYSEVETVEEALNQKKEIIKYMLEGLNKKETIIKYMLNFRSIGPVQALFTPHGTLKIYPRLRNTSIKKKIKRSSKFANKELKAYYNQLYKKLLDSTIPWNATVERDEDFKKRLAESHSRLGLLWEPITTTKDTKHLPEIDITIFKTTFKIIFEPEHKAIQIEGAETENKHDSLFYGYRLRVRRRKRSQVLNLRRPVFNIVFLEAERTAIKNKGVKGDTQHDFISWVPICRWYSNDPRSHIWFPTQQFNIVLGAELRNMYLYEAAFVGLVQFFLMPYLTVTESLIMYYYIWFAFTQL